MSKKKKIIISVSVLGAVVCLLLLAVGYLSLGSKYKEIFYPNTYINGIDCSNMTAREAEEKILSALEDYTLTIRFRGNKTETIAGKDFEYTYASDGSIENFLEEQDYRFWFSESKKEHTYTVKTLATYSEDLLTEHVNALPELKKSSMKAPEDARIEYKDNQYVIIDSKEGTTLNPKDVLKAVQEAVADAEPELDLEEGGFYARPSVLSDDKKLVSQVQQLNELANAHITYTLPDNTTVELTPEMLKEWLTQNEDGSYSRDEAAYEEHLRTFIADLSAKANTNGSDRLFDTTMDGTITVPYSTYSNFKGYEVDTDGELETLKAQIDEHQFITREPVYLTTGGGVGNHGVGGTYVELNLSRQHLWYYKDGTLAFDTNIVSGTMTTWRYTPAGWYQVAVKSSPHTMKGEINPATNEPIYIATCTYWMNFIPSLGIGFHDYDSGRSDWSSTAYLYNGSHGCINMHLSDAKTLYGMLEVGTPVIVYYTEPYTLRKELSPAEKYALNPTPSTTPTPEPTPETPSTPVPTTPPATDTPAPTETPEPTPVEPSGTPEGEP